MPAIFAFAFSVRVLLLLSSLVIRLGTVRVEDGVLLVFVRVVRVVLDDDDDDAVSGADGGGASVSNDDADVDD